MFLSRLTLNPRSRLVRRDVGDCQALHRTVMSAFPEGQGDAARAKLDVLHRLEVHRQSDRIVLYVQSGAEPNWSSLASGYALEVRVKPVDEQYASIHSGAILAFRLLANPTRKVDTKSGPGGKRRNGRRLPVTGNTELLEWLERKASTTGFELLPVAPGSPAVDVRVLPQGTGPTTGAHRNGPITLSGVVFEGRLRVTDTQRFLQALVRGIGSGKAYGYGLLSVAPGIRA